MLSKNIFGDKKSDRMRLGGVELEKSAEDFARYADSVLQHFVIKKKWIVGGLGKPNNKFIIDNNNNNNNNNNN